MGLEAAEGALTLSRNNTFSENLKFPDPCANGRPSSECQ
jgi:hypothetical protein